MELLVSNMTIIGCPGQGVPSLGVASRADSDGFGVQAAACALAAKEKRCTHRGLFVVTGSGLASSLLSGDITDGVFRDEQDGRLACCCISAWSLSISGGRQSPEIVKRSSFAPISSFLALAGLNAAAMQQE